MMNYAALASDGLEKLTMRLGLGEDEEAATLCQDLAEITVVATRAAQLTRQLLIFSRREVPRAEVIDLNAIVTDMEKLLGQALGEAIELVTDLAPDLPRTNVDRGQHEMPCPEAAAFGSRPQAARLRATGPASRATVRPPVCA
jgi:hypothetical protein